MTGRITDIAKDLNGRFRVTLTLDHANPDLLDEWKDKTLDLTEHREKRSKNANAYAWVLMGKIAAKLGTTPEEVYRQIIPEIGNNYEIVCVQDQAVEKLRQGWSRNGLGWMTDTMTSKIKGCTNVILYYGSSTYDKEQMTTLLNRIIEEAKELHIETLTPEELARMENTL